ncbi:MAG TPA: hypothetical protein VGM85_10705 [Paraburkholderia sp.]|jgi:uncharacterized protein YjbJ (UPF0337 family)
MNRKDQRLPSEARGSVKEAIGKLTGDRAAEAEGAAEIKAARERRETVADVTRNLDVAGTGSADGSGSIASTNVQR